MTGPDTGPITAAERRMLATVPPFAVGEIASHLDRTGARMVEGHELGTAPTPRVEVLPDLLGRRTPLTDHVLGGRYRLGRQLGSGGYGTVFAAEDLITGDRVAIKVLSPVASQNHELIIRFHREAIAASRARHPHIIDIADFDVDQRAGHFIVMEHLDGRDLAQILAESRPLPAARALVIAAQCARGLAAAHRVGVLHRDLKPANVFLVQRETGGHSVKIIDFGISKLMPIAGDYTDVTSASKVVGTPCYMSPEQARGADLDARSDVYALGVMLFEMVVGERPFTGRSPIEILSKHLSAPRVAPSALRPELAACPGLDALVTRALAPNPADRFESMEAFGAAIVACLRAIAPDAADNVTDVTGEQTDRIGQAPEHGSATTAARDVASRARSRWLAIGVAVIAASLALVGWQSRERAAAPSLSPPAAIAESTPIVDARSPRASPAAAPAPPEHAAASAGDREITITSTPRGIVYRDGARIGVTPLRLVIEAGSEPPALTVEAPGYRGQRIVVAPDQDRVDVVLRAIRSKPTAKPRAAAPARGVAEW